MKIEEAIKSLKQHTRYLEYLSAFEQVDAHRLGIEALKRVKDCRDVVCDFAPTLLPGETKE